MIDIRVKNIQDKLNDKDCFELEFKDNICIVITKDEIYIKNWTPLCPTIRRIKRWHPDMIDNFNNYNYQFVEEFTDLEVNDIISTMFEECKYSIRKNMCE